MFGIKKETVERIRQEYPAGCRVQLDWMEDIHAPKIGTLGTVAFVDDIGTIHVRGDNGSGLGVAYGGDRCHVV